MWKINQYPSISSERRIKSYILFINVPISGHIKYIIYQLAIIHKGLEKINSSFSQNLYQYMYLIVIDSKKIELFLKFQSITRGYSISTVTWKDIEQIRLIKKTTTKTKYFWQQTQLTVKECLSMLEKQLGQKHVKRNKSLVNSHVNLTRNSWHFLCRSRFGF